jgi:DNA-binding MurR/RpiR family transcriptional regulator
MDMPPNESVPEFIARVQGEKSGLSPQLVRVADYVMEAPQDLGWYGIVEFAELCGVPPATVVRFARRFGYGQYTDLRKIFRDAMRRHVNAAMLFS